MTDLTKLSPSEVDTIYLERLAALQRAWREVEYASLAVLRESGRGITVEVANRKGYPVHETVYVHPSFGQTLQAWYRTYKLDDVRVHVLTVERCLAEGLAPAAAAKLAQAEAACRDAQAACHEVETEYDRRPWSRYWLVTSSDGHIHRSTCCSTCNKGLNRTGFALTPFLSGKADSDAVADLGPALCSVCFPEAPVESKEQARIPARLALALAEEGVEAFQKARQEAAAKQAARCPGSGQQGLPGSHRAFHKCPVCGESQRATPGGKFRPHKPARFNVENADYKAWNGSAWGPKTKAAIYGSLEEAEAVAAQVGGTARRK
jgi:hypothetical protein